MKIDGGIRVYFSCICLVGKVYAMLFSFVAMHHLFGCFSIKLSFLDSSVWLLCVYSPVMSSYSSNDCGIILALDVSICQFSPFVAISHRALHC